MTHIEIYENGVFAGTGKLRDGIIEDCAAVLGDDQDQAEKIYDAIEEAIDSGKNSVTVGSYNFEWTIMRV